MHELQRDTAMKHLAPALLLALAACSTPQPQIKYVPIAGPLCEAVKTTCINKDDQFTESTAAKIEANNLGRAKICPAQPEDRCKTKKPPTS